MNAAAVFGKHLWIDTIELIRLPMYSVSTVVFPTLLYLLFGLPYGHSQEASRLIMSSFCAYAVIGVTLFQFGVGIATDRNSPWEQYLRVLPVNALTRLSAQVTAALFFATGSVGVVIVAAAIFGHAAPDAALLLQLVPMLLLGSIPFALLGITIGYWAGRRSALPIANLVYLPIALGGGLWMPPEALPKFIAAVSPFLPSRHYGEVVWAVARGHATPVASWLWLLDYAVIFGCTAIWGYARDESRNYR
jgi:ABC-2 type transport system permease protein